MLINATSKKHSLWSEEQLSAARDFGEIVDMMLPGVSDGFPGSLEMQEQTGRKMKPERNCREKRKTVCFVRETLPWSIVWWNF